MKNRIKQYLLAASMCVGLTACSDFFEPIPGVQFGLDETFASKQRDGRISEQCIQLRA